MHRADDSSAQVTPLNRHTVEFNELKTVIEAAIDSFLAFNVRLDRVDQSIAPFNPCLTVLAQAPVRRLEPRPM